MMIRGKISLNNIMALANLWSFFMPISMAIDSNCDYYQDVALGQQYYIYNQDYPSYYPPSTSCRWIAKSPIETVIVISCEEIDLPSSADCSGDRLAISLTGNTNFNDARNYCGKGSVSLVTDKNALTVGLFASSSSTGGKFVCVLTAIQDNNIVTTTSTTTEKPINCDCGWRQQTRIVGGQETGVNEYPAMAALIDLVNRDLFCGATILSDRYALTAAHCVNNRSPSNVALLVGDHNITSGTETAAAALYPISNFIIHNNYDSTTQAYDIAIVRTSKVITFSLSVGAICLPFRYSTDDFSGETVTALGWGLLEFSGSKSDTLQKVDLTVITNNFCASQVADPVTSNEICTYSPPKDTCQSDSGGPLLWFDGQTRRLQVVGVISHGLGCGATPAINTRVTNFLNWIISSTSDAVYCFK